MNYQSKSFKMYFEGKLIGTLTGVCYEMFDAYADLVPTPAFEALRADFAYMTDDSNSHIEELEKKRWDMIESYAHDWILEDDAGEKEAVFVPAIHDDLVVQWRWGVPEDLEAGV